MSANDPAPHRILIADDQPDVLEALRLLLKAEGYQIETVKSPAAVIKAVEARDFSLAIIDLNYTRDTTSGQEGLELLAKLQAVDPTLPVVVMTAWASVEIAVEAHHHLRPPGRRRIGPVQRPEPPLLGREREAAVRHRFKHPTPLRHIRHRILLPAPPFPPALGADR